MEKQELDTPAFVVDLDIMEKNIRDMATLCRKREVNLRPMVKTHKTPQISRLMLDAGAHGIQTAKISEAEVMLDAGITDIFISNQTPPLRPKLEKLAKLAHRGRITSSIDSLEGARGLSAAATKYGVEFDFLVEIDVGYGRTGVLPGEDAVKLAREAAGMKGLNFKGIFCHEGNWRWAHDTAGQREISIRAAQEMVKTSDLSAKGRFGARSGEHGCNRLRQACGWVSRCNRDSARHICLYGHQPCD